MKVTAGYLKGREIRGNISARPSSKRVKQAVFSILYSLGVDNNVSYVADLFCGSGAYGIEAISRGAKKVYFVDISAKSLQVTKRNLDNLEVDPACYVIVKSDVLKWLKKKDDLFDLVFVDPPYGFNSYGEILTILNANTVVVESGKRIDVKESNYRAIVEKNYGQSYVTVLERCI